MITSEGDAVDTLQVRLSDRAFFKANFLDAFLPHELRHVRDVEEGMEDDSIIRNEVHWKMYTNGRAIATRLEQLREKMGEDFVNFVAFFLRHCKLVQIIYATPDLQEAVRIFVLTNARGLPLSRADTIKPLLCQRLPEETRDDCMRQWEHLQQNLLTAEQFTNFCDTFRLVRETLNMTQGRINEDQYRELLRGNIVSYFQHVVSCCNLDHHTLSFSTIQPAYCWPPGSVCRPMVQPQRCCRSW